MNGPIRWILGLLGVVLLTGSPYLWWVNPNLLWVAIPLLMVWAFWLMTLYLRWAKTLGRKQISPTRFRLTYSVIMAIRIIDYGMANLRSVQKAFAEIGETAEIITTPQQIAHADQLVLPGVGAFRDAIATLRDKHLDEPIIEHIKKHRPMLGICLGLQMLFELGFEDGEHRGLGVLAGKCIRFDVDQTMGLKVPHMGWNQLNVKSETPLLKDVSPGAGVYFVHGYHVLPDDASVIATTTDYGRPFVSSIRRGNLMATQFHPEKSQKVGLQILANFARV